MTRAKFPEMWATVVQAAGDMTNASGRNQRALGRKHYRELEALVRSQVRRRRSHAWVLETLADFTENNRKAVGLYRKALRLARLQGLAGHTILLELAKRHFEIRGGKSLARRYLSASLSEARRRHDRDVVKEALEVQVAMSDGRPNTRVQRIRSSPSALRSPLTRQPLGGPRTLDV